MNTNAINQRTKEILNEYRNFVGLPNGWESSLSLSEFLQARDFAIQEMKAKVFSNSLDASGHGIKTHSNMAGLLENHDYKDISSAKKFLSLVENEEKIGDLIKDIDNTSNNDIVYAIGDDDSEEYADYSIIKANYSLKSGVVASIGVVGPQRLDYCRIASVLKFITDEISQIENDLNKED